MSAAKLLLRRSLTFALVVIGSSIVFGGLLWFAPGSKLGGGDGSFIGWVADFWRGVFTGDLGRSYRGYPVSQMVWRGAGRSLPLIGAGLALSLSAGLGLALAAGPRLRGAGRLVRIGVHALSLCPVFLLGYLALVLFAVPPEGAGQVVAAVAILALGDGMLSDVILGLDAELARLRRRDFVQSARLRGTPLWRHYVPHLALPVAQIAASRMAWLIGGVLVLEMVLGIQGIGLIGYRAADPADFPLLVAITVFVTAIVAGSGLLVDVLRVIVDPRARKDRRAMGRS